MAKKKSSPEADVNADATPTTQDIADQLTRSEPPTPDELKAANLSSDPQLDDEQTTANIVAMLVRSMSDHNFRIVRRKVKVGGVWYHVEVSRP